jgi:DNA-binding response OmpR family regulator
MPSEYRFDDVLVDLQARAVRKKGKLVSLSAREYQLLRVLIERRGRVLAREELRESAWGSRGESGSSRSVDNCVVKLRQKLEPDPRRPRYIVAVYGNGYGFMG